MKENVIYILAKTWVIESEGYGTANIGAFTSREKAEAAMEKLIKEIVETAELSGNTDGNYDVDVDDNLWKYHFANGKDVIAVHITEVIADKEYSINYDED